jgi:hypothetical protein
VRGKRTHHQFVTDSSPKLGVWGTNRATESKAGKGLNCFCVKIHTSGSAMATAIVSAWTSKSKNRNFSFMTGSFRLWL